MNIFFDMDGTIANLYGVDGWLDYILAEDTTPYAEAKVMLNMSALARRLNTLQKQGHKIGVISWLAKCGSDEYHKAVTNAKLAWLKKHLASVKWDKVEIVSYGYAKQTFAETEQDILFDDEKPNRDNWTGKAYGVENILEVLKGV